jgi:hypothetical protein
VVLVVLVLLVAVLVLVHQDRLTQFLLEALEALVFMLVELVVQHQVVVSKQHAVQVAVAEAY